MRRVKFSPPAVPHDVRLQRVLSPMASASGPVVRFDPGEKFAVVFEVLFARTWPLAPQSIGRERACALVAIGFGWLWNGFVISRSPVRSRRVAPVSALTGRFS